MRNKWEEFWETNSSLAVGDFIRPSAYFANGFANTDPAILNSLMRGGSLAYAQSFGGGVTNITYQVGVGGVEVTIRMRLLKISARLWETRLLPVSMTGLLMYCETGL